MADGLPNTLELREIKYSLKTTSAERIAAAASLERAGRLTEALDLLLLAHDEPGIARLSQRAAEEGQVILLLALRREGRAVAAAEWKKAGCAAEKAGRWREAFRAFSEAGDEEALARMRERLPGYELWQPQGK
ncbi:MAG: hypothetical protein ACT4PV_01695 [Planctomycetaceae bacterium]